MDMTDIASIPGKDQIAKVAADGIGNIAGSFLTVRNAKQQAKATVISAQAKAEATVISAQADAEALSIRTEAHQRALSTTSTGYDEALTQSPDIAISAEISINEVIEQKIKFQEARRLTNTAAIVTRAQDIVGDTQVPNQEPDHDWTARFFNYIQDVSSEDMQLLWARVLAGEVERPGTISLRTLGILRNLDRRTAKSFRRLRSISVCLDIEGQGKEGQIESHIMDCRAVSLGKHAGQNSLQSYGLRFDTLNELNEHGLIIAEYNSWYDYKLCIGIESGANTLKLPLTYQGTRWWLEPLDKSRTFQDFKLNGVAMTRVGKELSRVIEIERVPAYDQALIHYFKSLGVRITRLPL